MHKFLSVTATAVLIGNTMVAPAQAQTVNLTGNLLNSCILSVSTGGVLAPTQDGQTITTETPGGLAAVLLMVAVGSRPTVRFTAPTLEAPAGYDGVATTMIRYNSLSGVNQAYTSATSSGRAGALLDTFTINGRVESPDGFASGRYNVQTVVTCEQ